MALAALTEPCLWSRRAQLADQANGRFSINIGGCQGNSNLGYDGTMPPVAASLKDFQVYNQVLPDSIIGVRGLRQHAAPL